MTLTLISTPLCPFVQRAVITLKEKGVLHEVKYIDLDNKPDWFLAISPLGKVPLLQVETDGKAPGYVFESSVIVEYLEETAEGRKLHPEDALERASHRSWMEFASQTIIDHMKFVTAATDADRDIAYASFRAKLERLDATVKGPFFSGDVFRIVDAAFAPLFRQIDVLEPILRTGVLDGLDHVGEWRENLSQRPSVRDAVPADYAERYVARMSSFESLVAGKLRNG